MAAPPRRRPRLLFVGGSDVHLRLELMRALAPRFVVAAAGSDAGSAASIEAAGFEFMRYPMERGFSPSGDALTFLHLLRLLRAWRPDAVHAFDGKPTVWARLAARACGVPVIVGTLPGLGSIYTRTDRRALVLRHAFETFQRVASRASDFTVFQNGDDRRQLVNAGVVPAAKSGVIAGSGVRTDALAPGAVAPAGNRAVRALAGAVADAPLVTMIARVIRSKGVLEFASAADVLRRRFPDARFLLVGPDDRESSECLSAAERDRLERSVNWLGPRDDVPAILAATDVFALPSWYREGVPRVLIEAAAMGLPLVAARTPGCTDVIEHGRNGLLVEPRDPASLADALATLLADPELRRRFGERSRQIAVSRFDLTIVADRLAELYLRLLER